MDERGKGRIEIINQTDVVTEPPNCTQERANTELLTQIVQEIIWLSGTAIYQYWFNLECQGRENLPRDRGYIIAANHNSHLDGPAIVAAQGQHISQVYSLAARDYFFDRPLKAWLCQNFLNMIPFKRRGKFLDCLPACQRVIAQHKSLLFFPEGTRSLTGEIQPFKLGLGMLAIELNVPVVPAYIQGTYQALPKGKHFPKKHPLRVSFGSPLEFNYYQTRRNEADPHQIYREIANEVYMAIQKLKGGECR